MIDNLNLLFGNTPNIVGRISYKSQVNVPTDIFGNEIDFGTLTSYEHEPIYTGTVDRGYEPKYSKIFNSDSEDAKTPDIDEESETISSAPAQTVTLSQTPDAEKIETPQQPTPTVAYSGKKSERAKWWMNQFANLGVGKNQQIAIVSAMLTECGLNPKGSVNKKEFAGKGNTEAGWAGAGEGAVGFTHWDLKKKMIDLYNADPRRKGPKLSNVKSEYAKNSSRHIADLDDEDHALMTYLYYQKLLKRTNGLNFDDTIAEFYLEKAGRGYGKGAGANATPYEKAVYTGKRYQKFHADQGYTKASKTNVFLKSLNYARNLASQVGYNQNNSQTPTTSSKVAGNHVFKHQNMNVGNMQALLDEAAKHGISFRVTSGVRPGSRTKSGNVSWHASGNAIDVTPIAGQTYDDLRQAIRNNPAFVKWMQDRGYGIYEEITSDVMARTGATGKHWHIGKDKVAIKGLQNMIS